MSNRILFKNGAYLNPTPLKQVNATYTINITADTLTFKTVFSGTTEQTTYDEVTNETTTNTVNQNTIVDNWTLSLSELKKCKSLKSNSLFAINPPHSDSQVTAMVYQCISVGEFSLQQKTLSPNALKSTAAYNMNPYPLFILVKDVNGTFEDHDIFLLGDRSEYAINVVSNVEFATEETARFDFLNFVDSITISKDTTYTNENYIRYNITTGTGVDTIYLDPVVGIVDKARVTITNGQGSFRVLSNSVDGTDKITVKAGFYTYPRVVTFTDE